MDYYSNYHSETQWRGLAIIGQSGLLLQGNLNHHNVVQKRSIAQTPSKERQRDLLWPSGTQSKVIVQASGTEVSCGKKFNGNHLIESMLIKLSIICPFSWLLHLAATLERAGTSLPTESPWHCVPVRELKEHHVPKSKNLLTKSWASWIHDKKKKKCVLHLTCTRVGMTQRKVI